MCLPSTSPSQFCLQNKKHNAAKFQNSSLGSKMVCPVHPVAVQFVGRLLPHFRFGVLLPIAPHHTTLLRVVGVATRHQQHTGNLQIFHSYIHTHRETNSEANAGHGKAEDNVCWWSLLHLSSTQQWIGHQTSAFRLRMSGREKFYHPLSPFAKGGWCGGAFTQLVFLSSTILLVAIKQSILN